MKNYSVLFRKDLDCEDEYDICSKHIKTYNFRSEIEPNSLVIARYSALPFYRELERELALKNSKLINSYQQHCFIADINNWASVGAPLEKYTPKTYDNWANLPEGSYVLKGKTNSRKNQWKTKMFAESKADIPRIAQSLLDDSLISEQGIVVREYVPLRQFDVAINGLPITNEWRTFWIVINNSPVLISKGYYWSTHEEFFRDGLFTSEAESFAKEVAEKMAPYANFFVLDIAEKASGGWILIEVNDAQQSGLSMIDKEEFYKTLSSYEL